MHISNNSSTTANSCWKKFYWRYVERLTPIRQSSSLTLGSIVHEAFDLHYKNTPYKDVIKFIAGTFDEEIAKLPPEEQEHLTVAKYTALGMFANFPYKNLAQFDEVHSEKSFSVKLLNGNRYTDGMTFEGRIDGLVKKNGKWWVRELKTTGQTSRIFSQRINTSSQGTGYVWAMKKLGYDVVGLMYDYVKRPLLRKRMSEDQFEFGNRILKDYADKPEAYFNQVYSYRNTHELNLWEKDIKDQAKEIRRKFKAGDFYRNTGSCYNYNMECPYNKICFEEHTDNLMLSLYFLRDGEAINADTLPPKDNVCPRQS